MRRGLAIVAGLLIGASACMAANYYRQMLMLPRAAGGTAPAWNYPESAGIVLRFSGNLTAATNAADESGGEFNGVPYPTPTNGPTIANGCYLFDGIDDYYQITGSDFSKLNGKSNVTWAAWVKPVDSGTTFPRILDRVYNGQFAFYVNETFDCIGAAVKPFQGGTPFDQARMTSDSSVTFGAWNHICVTYDGQTLIGYVNGVQRGAEEAPSGQLADSTANMRIGQRTDAGLSRLYEGCIDELIVWTNKLASNQVYDVYLNGPQPTP